MIKTNFKRLYDERKRELAKAWIKNGRSVVVKEKGFPSVECSWLFKAGIDEHRDLMYAKLKDIADKNGGNYQII